MFAFTKIIPGLIPQEISPTWTRATMLGKTGVFRLEEVAVVLGIPAYRAKAAADALKRSGENPLETMGVVHDPEQGWLVEMSSFAGYSMANLTPEIMPVDPTWDGNMLLRQPGRFYLVDVCERIPFTPQQFRYQHFKRDEEQRVRELGVFKKGDVYVVNMPVFSVYVRVVWQEIRGCPLWPDSYDAFLRDLKDRELYFPESIVATTNCLFPPDLDAAGKKLFGDCLRVRLFSLWEMLPSDRWEVQWNGSSVSAWPGSDWKSVRGIS